MPNVKVQDVNVQTIVLAVGVVVVIFLLWDLTTKLKFNCQTDREA